MTTPVDNFLMPFSIPHESTPGVTWGFSVREAYRTPGGPTVDSVVLPPGKSTLLFTWNGPEGLRFMVRRKVGGVWQDSAYRIVIESGTIGITRTSQPFYVVSPGVEETAIYLQTTSTKSQATIDARCVASVDVITLPPKGMG